jgi:NADH-quinone oxidoreductase subunit L
MARLMAMTFFGENRTGEKEREHLHEAPWIMTGPLVVLGLLSLAGGLLNLPELVGGDHRLETYLEPLLKAGQELHPLAMPHGQTEYLLIGLAVAIALGGLVLGWRATLAARTLPAREASPERGFMKLLYNKYYVDEFYSAIIVRPLVEFSRSVLWKATDQGLIDGGMVNGTARLQRALGWLGSRLQTGQVGVYIFAFMVGVLYIVGVMIQ